MTMTRDDAPVTPRSRVTLTVSGDLDLEGGLRLRTAVRESVGAAREADLTLNLDDVRFMDCAGVGALLWSRRHLRDGGGGLVVEASNRSVMRLLQHLGLAGLLAAPGPRLVVSQG